MTTTLSAPAPSITTNIWGGHALNHCRNTSEALSAAGLDWEVVEHPLFDATGPVAGWKSLRRSDNGAQLSVVGKGYVPIQNREAFSPLDAFIGDLSLDHALCLRGGRRVVLTAKVGLEADVTSGDPVEGWLVIYNSHDGSLAYGLMFTPVRVICQNTLSWAINRQNRLEQQDAPLVVDDARLHRKRITFKHTKSVSEQISKLPELIDLKSRQFLATVDQYRAMRATPCSTAQFHTYLEMVFRDTLLHPQTRQLRPLTSLKALPYLEEAFESGIGAETMRGTLWGAYNSITQWASHKRGRTDEDRLESNWFGPGANLLRTAHTTALELTRV